MGDRRRNALVLLIVLGLLAASAAIVASNPTRLGLDLKGGVQLIYQGRATAQAKVDSESLNRAIDIMRKRVDQLGVAQPEIQRTGDIFFPARWTEAVLGNQRSPEAAAIVRDYVAKTPALPERLRWDVLAAADNLFRASGPDRRSGR